MPEPYNDVLSHDDRAAHSEGLLSELGLFVQNADVGGAWELSEALMCGGFGWEYPWDGRRRPPAWASGEFARRLTPEVVSLWPFVSDWQARGEVTGAHTDLAGTDRHGARR
jgi:hypothetical protein